MSFISFFDKPANSGTFASWSSMRSWRSMTVPPRTGQQSAPKCADAPRTERRGSWGSGRVDLAGHPAGEVQHARIGVRTRSRDRIRVAPSRERRALLRLRREPPGVEVHALRERLR